MEAKFRVWEGNILQNNNKNNNKEPWILSQTQAVHAAVLHQVHRALPIRMGDKNKALKRSGATNDSSTVEKCDVAGVWKGRRLWSRGKSETRFTFPFERLPDWRGVHVLKNPFAKPFCFCTVCNYYLMEQREDLGKRELTGRGRDRGRDGG